jgi:hypothetical protein
VDRASLRSAVGELDDSIRLVCLALFARRKANPQGLAWWNDSCRLAVAGLSGTHGKACRQAYIVLRTTIRGAKRDWYEKLLEDPEVSIWDLVKWRHGCRQLALPPIRDTEGLTTDPPRVAEAFWTRFFPPSSTGPVGPLPDLAFPTHPTRAFLEVM